MSLNLYTLTIKGEPMHADAALSAHGFGGDHVADMDTEQLVRIASHDDLAERLNEWFNEPMPNGMRYTPPFIPGTLLLWRKD